MRKVLSVVMVIVALFGLCFSFAGCGEEADYESPQKMYEAYAAGENIIGKTVEVYASKDYTMGMIFSGPAPDMGPTIYVNCSGDGADKIKSRDTVICKITGINYADKFGFSVNTEIAD